MRKRSILLVVGALAIAASLVVGPAATAGPESASAGTVVFIHDQEPPNLQGPWVGNNLYATALVLNNIWYGGQIRDAKGDLQPRLFTAKPKVVKASPLTVSFSYKPTAKWSDGKPVTSRRLPGDAPGLHQPAEQRDLADGLGGHPLDLRSGQERHGRVQDQVRGLGVAGLERRLPRSRHRGQEHERDVLERHPGRHLERSVALRELAEGRPAHRGEEREVPGRPRR